MLRTDLDEELPVGLTALPIINGQPIIDGEWVVGLG